MENKNGEQEKGGVIIRLCFKSDISKQRGNPELGTGHTQQR